MFVLNKNKKKYAWVRKISYKKKIAIFFSTDMIKTANKSADKRPSLYLNTTASIAFDIIIYAYIT